MRGWTGRKYREISRKIGKNTNKILKYRRYFRPFFEILLRLFGASIHSRFIGSKSIYRRFCRFFADIPLDHWSVLNFVSRPHNIRYIGEISPIKSDFSIHASSTGVWTMQKSTDIKQYPKWENTQWMYLECLLEPDLLVLKPSLLSKTNKEISAP